MNVLLIMFFALININYDIMSVTTIIIIIITSGGVVLSRKKEASRLLFCFYL
jgi:hypothetical protein